MSLHARKGLAKITALPHCSNMAGGGWGSSGNCRGWSADVNNSDNFPEQYSADSKRTSHNKMRGGPAPRPARPESR